MRRPFLRDTVWFSEKATTAKSFEIVRRRHFQHITDHAKYMPFGATLTILYQIHNNLFHGSKMELNEADRGRNQLLTSTASHILQTLLTALAERIIVPM